MGSPQLVAGLFLGYWNTARYADMYGLISKEAKATITKDQFVARYQAITAEATVTKMTAALTAGQAESATAQEFDVVRETALVGTLTEHNTMSLIQEPDGWKVQWLPSLIFKDLTGDNLIHMFPYSKPRGGIIDRTGAILAEEGPAVSVDIVPKNTPDLGKTAAQVAALLKIPQQQVQKALDKVQGHPDWRAPVKTLTPAQLAPLHDALAAVPGVLLTEVSLRTYPQGRSACNVVGYINEITADELNTAWKDGYLEGDLIGRSGIEHWGERTLMGHRGGKLAVVTPAGDVWTVIAEQEALPGKNIQLTLDVGLQKVAEAAIGKLTGSAVVMRVSDGSILAAASNPGYDPNAFILGMTPEEASALFNDPQHPFQNRPMTGLYPTGSLFKTITMSTVLQHGLYGPGSTFSCPGYWNGLGIRMNCWKPGGHGAISLFEGLAQSCDVVFYLCGQAADRASHALLPDTAKGFGLGVGTGLVGLSDEAGVVPDPAWKEQNLKEPWYPGDPVNLAVGQGYLLVTPLQVANWIAAIANGGTIWTPRIADKIITPGGGSTDPNPPKPRGQLPIAPDKLQVVREAMREAVAETRGWAGTAAWPFRDFPIPVAAKTGTAQSGKPKPHAWFASFAPADKPEIAVVTMIELADAEGSYIAAPIAREIYKKYFNVAWEQGVKKENAICVDFEYLCPWQGKGAPRKVQYGD